MQLLGQSKGQVMSGFARSRGAAMIMKTPLAATFASAAETGDAQRTMNAQVHTGGGDQSQKFQESDVLSVTSQSFVKGKGQFMGLDQLSLDSASLTPSQMESRLEDEDEDESSSEEEEEDGDETSVKEKIKSLLYQFEPKRNEPTTKFKATLHRDDVSDEAKAAQMVDFLISEFSKTFIWCRQLAILVTYFKYGKVRKTEHFGTYNVELIVALYNRIMDIHNMEIVLHVVRNQ